MRDRGHNPSEGSASSAAETLSGPQAFAANLVAKLASQFEELKRDIPLTAEAIIAKYQDVGFNDSSPTRLREAQRDGIELCAAWLEVASIAARYYNSVDSLPSILSSIETRQKANDHISSKFHQGAEELENIAKGIVTPVLKPLDDFMGVASAFVYRVQGEIHTRLRLGRVLSKGPEGSTSGYSIETPIRQFCSAAMESLEEMSAALPSELKWNYGVARHSKEEVRGKLAFSLVRYCGLLNMLESCSGQISSPHFGESDIAEFTDNVVRYVPLCVETRRTAVALLPLAHREKIDGLLLKVENFLVFKIEEYKDEARKRLRLE